MSKLAELDVEWSMDATVKALKEGLAEMKVDRSSSPWKVDDSASNLELLDLILVKVGEAEEYYWRPVDDHSVYEELYEIHMALGRDNEAQRFKAQIARREAEKWEFQGRLLNFFGNNKRAVIYYKKALELDPNFDEAAAGLDKASKRVAKAEKEMEKLEKKASLNNSCKDWTKYGQAIMDTGDVMGARDCFEKALALDGEDIDALWRIAATYEAQADFNSAMPYIEKALGIKETALNPKRCLNYATYFLERTDEASELFKED